ncbi:MAG: Eco57I restriction-modification methylase domain-containing protein [Sandaracinus sp.]
MKNDAALAPSSALADAYRDLTDDEHKKEWGQFFTSPTIAAFMASLLRPPSRREVRVLDPGAGAGVLGLAAAQALIAQGARVHLVAVEREPGALRLLRDAAHEMQHRTSTRSLHVDILDEDFLDLDRPRLGSAALPRFDYAIANPPYFKISPSDERGGDAPNVYARFMEVSARMLVDGGDLCFIVPRSYAAGFYFRPFRRRFHASMRLDHVHLFESRRDAFRTDGVLQENIIALYRRTRDASETVRISSSAGERDLEQRFAHDVPRARVVAPDDANSVVSLPANERELRVLDRFRGWRDNLASYGLEVSTGPVVPFRAEEHLRAVGSKTTAPMLWLQHVLPGRVEWPLDGGFRKPEHIEKGAPEKLLVRNRTYVLLRRFSAKEDERRLVAAPYIRNAIRSPVLGLENHVNFIHRRRGELAEGEARALSALLNSALFDAYFRISNGNTQVSATELRALPLPPAAALESIGARLARGATEEQAVVEALGDT